MEVELHPFLRRHWMEVSGGTDGSQKFKGSDRTCTRMNKAKTVNSTTFCAVIMKKDGYPEVCI
jgi:hypothetical protein